MARRVADFLAMQSQNAPSDLCINNDYITDPADVSRSTRKASHSRVGSNLCFQTCLLPNKMSLDWFK